MKTVFQFPCPLYTEFQRQSFYQGRQKVNALQSVRFINVRLRDCFHCIYKISKGKLKIKKLRKNWRITIKFHFENLSILLKNANVHTCQDLPSPWSFVRFSMTPPPPLLNERTFLMNPYIATTNFTAIENISNIYRNTCSVEMKYTRKSETRFNLRLNNHHKDMCRNDSL